MTVMMTTAQAAFAAAAAAEIRAARAAVARAARLVEEAEGLVGVHGDDGWLGPARGAFDDACGRLRRAAGVEAHELRLLEGAIEAAL